MERWQEVEEGWEGEAASFDRRLTTLACATLHLPPLSGFKVLFIIRQTSNKKKDKDKERKKKKGKEGGKET